MSAPIASLGEIRSIVALVSARTEISIEDLVSERRQRRTAKLRQLAMWVARKATGASLSSIGRSVGRRDHTTVLHALKRTERFRAEDEAFRALADGLLAAVAAAREQKAGAMATRAAAILEAAANAGGEVRQDLIARVRELDQIDAIKAAEARKRRQRDAIACSDSGVNWGSTDERHRLQSGTHSRRYFIDQNAKFCAAMRRAIEEEAMGS